MIITQLNKHFPYDFLDNINLEYKELRKSYFMEDLVKVGIHSGRICELISSILCSYELKQKENINNINFNKNINNLFKVPNKTSTQESTCLIIPRILQSIYTIRSKKRIAHFKQDLPKKIDIKYIFDSINWTISQLLIIFGNMNDFEVKKYLESISYDKFRKIERFTDGSIYFYENLSFSEKIIFVLGDHYNTGRIKRQILQNQFKKTSGYISSYIKNLKDSRLIHESDEGLILSRKGLEKLNEIKMKLY